MKKSILHFCILLLSIAHLYGQALRFQRFNTPEGFTNRGTTFPNSILKDREGFTYFTTHSGLSRFDGEHFKNYKHDPGNPASLPDNILTVVGEMDDSTLWIGTAIQGIFIFDKKREAFAKFAPLTAPEDHVLEGHIYFIEKDRQGFVWYGGDNGVGRWDPTTNKTDHFAGYFQNAQTCLFSSSGTVWIGDRNGLHRQSPEKDQFEKVPASDNNRYITDLLETADGKIWVAATSHFYELDPNDLNTKNLSDEDWLPDGLLPFQFAKGNHGDIWMAFNTGLLQYHQPTGQSVFYQNDPSDPLSLPPARPECILVDSADNLFITTDGHGVTLSHLQPHSFETIGDYTAMEFIALDSQRVLIRDFEKGGIIYDTKQRKVTDEKLPIGPGSIFLPTLALRGDSLLFSWNLGNDRIQSYHLRTGKLTSLPKNPNHSLYVNLDKKGRLWNGLSYFDEEENEWVFKLPELQQAFPKLKDIKFSYANIFFDQQNRMWAQVYRYRRLIRYDFERGEGKSYEIDGIAQEELNGRVYLKNANGFYMYDPLNDRFDLITEKDGLASAGAFHLQKDAHGNIWVASVNGIQKFDPITKKFTNIDLANGFPAKDRMKVLRFGKDFQGYFYFDLDLKKVVRFHPDSLHQNMETAPIKLLGFFLNRRQVMPYDTQAILSKNLHYTEAIELAFDQADFGFSFTMPVYYKSKEIEYFYRLVPYQQEWQSNGFSNEAHYTNISPGKYVFEVKAKTADGVWDTQNASVQVIVRPPWWETWWAYALYFLLFFAAVFGVYRFNLKRQYERQEAYRLKELDTLKSRLYTNITHEFRTPLTVILGNLEIMKLEIEHRANQFPISQFLISQIAVTRRNSKNLLRLINQLLDLSKLDSGTMKMDMVQGDLINYLRYLTESFYSMAQEKKIGLEFRSEVEVLEMDFDEVKIQHVIYNLLSNALKFTKENGSVQIHTSQKTRSGQPFLQIKMQDTGVGISAEQLPHIFDRFYQADNSTTRKGEGTGIGLALTKELVQMMGGTIEVKSTLGEGTLFTILLPVRKEATTALLEKEYATAQTIAPELVPDVFADNPESNAPVTADLPQLLLIEDNRDVATYIQSLLQNHYQVSIAPDGQRGIDQALETIPDLIITDVMMPEKNGYEVCETLKQDERTSHIPIVMLTAKAEQKDKVAGLKHGADAYLMKPFDKEELFVRLEKLLELRKALQEKYSADPSTLHRPPSTVPTIEELFLKKLRTATESVMADSENTIQKLEQAMHLSQMQLYRKLKALTGQTPTLYIRSVRLQKAKELLLTTDLNVSEVAYETGFSDPAYFSRAFSEEFGEPPSAFRK